MLYYNQIPFLFCILILSDLIWQSNKKKRKERRVTFDNIRLDPKGIQSSLEVIKNHAHSTRHESCLNEC